MSLVLRSIFALALLLSPALASAASFELWAPDPQVASGGLVEVRVLVESDQAFNALDGRIAFPSQLLSVVSISKQSSVVPLWVQEPIFSNSQGTIDFSGVVPNPGYSGPQRRVVTITFRAKEEGSARLAFASGSVLANDGAGTDLLEASRGTTLTIVAGQAPAPAEEAPVEPVEEVVPLEPLQLTRTPEAPAFDLRAFLFETEIPLVYFAVYVLASLLALIGFVGYYILGLRIKVYRVRPAVRSTKKQQIVEE